MNDEKLYSLRYPIGEYNPKTDVTPDDIKENITIIESFPGNLKKEVTGLSDAQLDTPYRQDGWTVRQVVHHVVDSHLNSYMRFKLTLTEDNPAIRPYFEDRWAEIPEAKSAPIELSLPLLEALHIRWVVMLRNITPQQLKRKYFHPETKNEATLEYLIGMYAWHSEHHLAHITELKKRMNW
jgi:hypothetical protein